MHAAYPAALLCHRLITASQGSAIELTERLALRELRSTREHPLRRGGLRRPDWSFCRETCLASYRFQSPATRPSSCTFRSALCIRLKDRSITAALRAAASSGKGLFAELRLRRGTRTSLDGSFACWRRDLRWTVGRGLPRRRGATVRWPLGSICEAAHDCYSAMRLYVSYLSAYSSSSFL